ncbi:hypothetical protein OBBRIDRAFT_168471 [Obba rivulosa]|uniref:Uncharacterized protein n=1 Tax=Obba rivulosa TaxID=1052685 RepID=A0A8E2AQ32_9APHY|nr:hypothetical protein OBBRIDRAFT_168471 [Obba rivulosa]
MGLPWSVLTLHRIIKLSPVFSAQCDKAIWTELNKDGEEADREKGIAYNLRGRQVLTDSVLGSLSSSTRFLARRRAYLLDRRRHRVRVTAFVLPIPQTSTEPTTDPDLPHE